MSLKTNVISAIAAFSVTSVALLATVGDNFDLSGTSDKTINLTDHDANQKFHSRIAKGCTDLTSLKGRDQCGMATQKAIKLYWLQVSKNYEAYHSALPVLSSIFGKTGSFGKYGDAENQAWKSCYTGTLRRGSVNFSSRFSKGSFNAKNYTGAQPNTLTDVTEHCFEGLENIEEALNIDLGLPNRSKQMQHAYVLRISY